MVGECIPSCCNISLMKKKTERMKMMVENILKGEATDIQRRISEDAFGISVQEREQRGDK